MPAVRGDILGSCGHLRGGLRIEALRRPGSFPFFVVSGPSGSGKTSLCVAVLSRIPWLRAAVSHTTRPPRPGEREGVDYVFVDRDAFERKVREGAFLEWAEVHGHLYGSSLESLRSVGEEQALLFEVDWKGADRIRRHMQDVISIFVMTPSLHDLVRRIEGRGKIRPDELNVRIRTATVEIQHAADFDYLVINDRFEEAVDELHSIILAGSCRRQVRLPYRVERWSKEISALQGNLPRDPALSPRARGKR